MTSKIQKACKICGKMFTPCSYCENDRSMFHWRRIACSQECAKKYFQKIEESRKPRNATETKQAMQTETSDIKKENENLSEDIKPKRNRKKFEIKNEESEQID